MRNNDLEKLLARSEKQEGKNEGNVETVCVSLHACQKTSLRWSWYYRNNFC